MGKLIDYSKLFDVFRNFYADISYHSSLSKTGSAIIPLRYFLELTYRCNLRCPYCYVGGDREKEELTTKQWFEVIKQIPWYSFVTLVGGEPLIRKDFSRILHRVSKQTFGKLNVVTNGILLTDAIIDELIRSKMMLLSVSLDGWGENHDKNRGKEGIFNKIHKNLESVNEKRKKAKSKMMVDIKTIVLQDNMDDILKLYKYCSEMGFEFLSISFLRNNDLKQNSVLRESFEPIFHEPDYPIEPYFDFHNFKEVYREIYSLSKKSKTKIRFSPKFEGGTFLQEIERVQKFFFPTDEIGLHRHPNKLYYPCKYPFSNMMINPTGDVYPCLSFKIGNVKDDRLIDIFNKPKFKCFRKNLKTSKTFSSCQMCCELTPKK